ncbi:MAG: hypothetical protein IKO56_02915 [Alphaproteobacteria bacterium]|nr:hypothetical protein [Alphaproteobacteria bacterium]
MIILENREAKTASFCNNDLKHLIEFTNVVVLVDDEWITICPTSNDYVFLKTRTSETTIVRTDTIFNPYVSFVYDVEETTDDTEHDEVTLPDNIIYIDENREEEFLPIHIDPIPVVMDDVELNNFGDVTPINISNISRP